MSININIIKLKFSSEQIEISYESNSTPFHRKSSVIITSVVKVFHNLLNKARILKEIRKNEFELLGAVLRDILMEEEEVRDVLKNQFDYFLRDKMRRCRVVLEFDSDCKDLAALPWEYMLMHGDSKNAIPPYYLGAHPDKKFDLFRVVRLKANVVKRTENSPDDKSQLRVIVLSVTEAANMPIPLNNRELMKKFDEFKEKNKGKFYVKFIEEPITLNTLEAKLNSEINEIHPEPYIIHYYGHSRMNDKKIPQISLLKEDKTIDWINWDDFIKFFQTLYKQLKLPSLVVLQSCETGQQNDDGHGIGIDIARTGVPAVVAMQNEITDNASFAFLDRLYSSLLSGDDIAEAVTNCRVYLACEYNKNKIGQSSEDYDTNEFGTPVLFISDNENSLVTAPIQMMPKSSNAHIKTEGWKCEKCGAKYKSERDRCNELIRGTLCRGDVVEIKSSDKSDIPAAQ